MYATQPTNNNRKKRNNNFCVCTIFAWLSQQSRFYGETKQMINNTICSFHRIVVGDKFRSRSNGFFFGWFCTNWNWSIEISKLGWCGVFALQFKPHFVAEHSNYRNLMMKYFVVHRFSSDSAHFRQIAEFLSEKPINIYLTDLEFHGIRLNYRSGNSDWNRSRRLWINNNKLRRKTLRSSKINIAPQKNELTFETDDYW